MITIKYKGEVIDPKDIEITWQEETYRDWQVISKTGTIEDYGHSQYSEGYDEGYEAGVDQYQDA